MLPDLEDTMVELTEKTTSITEKPMVTSAGLRDFKED